MATHTLIHFTPEHGDLRKDHHETIDDALEAAKRIDPTRLAYLSVPDDVAPNGMRLFKVDRTESGDAIHVDPTGPQVTTLHNALVEKPVARFSSRTAAIEKTTKVLSERLSAIEGQQIGKKAREFNELERTAERPYARAKRKEGEKVEVQEETKVEAKSRGGRKQTHTDDMIVVLKVDKNPKKEGNTNHKRFAAMMKAMKSGRCTVAEAIVAGATRGDLAYDEAHKYIEIIKA